MKRLLILFVILALAFIAAPAFATEALGPPGITVAPSDFDAVLSPVAVSSAPDVVSDIFRPVIGLALVAEKPKVEPMLAGLMYGARLNGWMDNAAEAYVIPVSDTRPSLGSVA